MPEFIILTGPVSSGKTSLLLRFIDLFDDCTGFLCPDIHGKRGMLSISNRVMHPFEVFEGDEDVIVKVGRFLFLKDTFSSMQKILEDAINDKQETVIIDEIGWMELQDKGLEPALTRFITSTRNDALPKRVVMVVREQLVGQVISKYGILDATLMDLSEFSKKYSIAY